MQPLAKDREVVDQYRILFRLQIAVGIGVLFIIAFALQFAGHTVGFGSVLRIIAVGVVTAGAALFVGFLLGFIFCIPRVPKQPLPIAKDGVITKREEDQQGDLETNTNLIDISDWLTKILVGVGLVELNKIPDGLQRLATFIAPGLNECEASSCVKSSQAFAIGIVVFFFSVGFLVGYLWTRYYYQQELSRLKRKVVQVYKAWADASTAEALLASGRLGEAMAVVDRALDEESNNPNALIIKGRILKRLAQSQSKPGDKNLLSEALTYASRAADLLPNSGGARYNMACYQALLATDRKTVLQNLEIAFNLNATLKQDAKTDEDLASLRDDIDFKRLTSNPEKKDNEEARD